MKKIDLSDQRQKARWMKAIDRAILDGDGGRGFEDLCEVMDRALVYYDDPNFAKDNVQ
jgi:hypothetical protein